MDGYECPFDELRSRYATCNDEIQATREANTIWAWCSSRYPVIEPDWEMKLESKRIAANAHAMVHSKLFSPETLKLDKHVVDAAISCVPQDVRSREADTVDSLRERIAACGFFDDLQALKGGGREGKKRVELNDTDYASPRRKSWSLVIEDTHVHRGKRVRTMFNYGKLNSRIRTIAYATPMPTAVYALGKQCFCTARHLLSTGSAMFPPNHCQLMAYYQIFRSKAGVHKDNYKVDPDFRNAMFRAFPFARFITGGMQVIPGLDRAMQQGRAQIEMFCQTASKNAQIDGSDVMIFSVGRAKAHFRFHFPSGTDESKNALFKKTSQLDVHPNFTVELSHGTLFIFKSVDDLLFQHDVVLCDDNPCTADRFAFCFRWMSIDRQCRFCAETGAMVGNEVVGFQDMGAMSGYALQSGDGISGDEQYQHDDCARHQLELESDDELVRKRARLRAEIQEDWEFLMAPPPPIP